MSTWLLIFLILIALPYLATPILIRYTQRFSPTPELRQLLSEFLPAHIRDTFEEITKSLSRETFIYGCDAVSYNPSQSLRLFFRTFIHPTKQVLAIVTAFIYEDLKDLKIAPSIEFISYFNDKTKLTTCNSDLNNAPIRPAKNISNTLILIKDSGQLFRVHLFYLKQIAKKRTPIFLEKEQSLTLLKKNLEEDLLTQASMGGLFLEKSSQEYRPTWAGAFLMAWYNMWPIVLFRRFYYNWRAKIWLKRISSAKSLT